MPSYDKVHALANELKNSEEYREYCQARDAAFEHEMNRSLYKEQKKVSMAINAAYMAGQEPSEDLKKKYQSLIEVLALNEDVTKFMMAEHKLNQMMGDIFNILAEAIDLNLDFLKD